MPEGSNNGSGIHNFKFSDIHTSPPTSKPKIEWKRFFSQEGKDPFDTIEWSTRNILVKNIDGKVIFEQRGVEFPSSWSQRACDTTTRHYFRGAVGAPDREKSFKQVVTRVVSNLCKWGEEQSYLTTPEHREIFSDELTYMLIHQMFSFNSPVWYNVGIEEEPQCSACVADYHLVHTHKGLRKLSSLKDEPTKTKVWDGYEWADVLAYKDNGKRSVKRITLADATFLDLTEDHVLPFKLDRHDREFKDVMVKDLLVGGYLCTTDNAVSLNTEIISIESNGKTNVSDIQTSTGYFEVEGVRVHNCFINSVQDSITSIMDLATRESRIFKYGSGAGCNLSGIRGSMEKLSTGGTASGPVSFMRGYDSFAGAMKSGGKTRRAAKMVVLDIDHPDIEDFISCKAEEERKMRVLLQNDFEGGLDGNVRMNAQFQNANNSVRLWDSFMHAVEEDGDWPLIARTTGEVIKTVKAKDLYKNICQAAWDCADPGVHFGDTINRMHTCPNHSSINSSNPCSEYLFIDDSACNLASLNLMKFIKDDYSFDINGFEHAVDLIFSAQEFIIDAASYPSDLIDRHSRMFRTIGLGYCNLGASLMSLGMPYDSKEGRDWAGAVTSLMSSRAYLQSCKLADHKQPFSGFEDNKQSMLEVLKIHAGANKAVRDTFIAKPMTTSTDTVWKKADINWRRVVSMAYSTGVRNAQATLLAPTGTISFMMDADTTGVEPAFQLITVKNLVGGGQVTIPVKAVNSALKKLGFSKSEISDMMIYLDEHGTLEGCTHLKDNVAVFDCANRCGDGTRYISPKGHINMMAAIQPFLSGAISKTVNLPEETTVEEFEDFYMQAWKKGIKCVAPYRDNCKAVQPLQTKKTEDKKDSPSVELTQPSRYKMGFTRLSVTHKVEIAGFTGYIQVGLKKDFTPGELFIRASKEGSTISGLLDAFATSVSYNLQYGVPLVTLCAKFRTRRFDPQGYSTIGIVTSIVDYIFKWMQMNFLDEHGDPAPASDILRLMYLEDDLFDKIDNDISSSDGSVKPAIALGDNLARSYDGPVCDECGHITQRSGPNCWVCPTCGNKAGCS